MTAPKRRRSPGIRPIRSIRHPAVASAPRCEHAEAVCEHKEPALKVIGTGHSAACHMMQPESGHSKIIPIAVAA